MSLLTITLHPLALAYLAPAYLALSLLYIIRSVSHSRRRKLERVSSYGPPSYPVIGCLISFYKNRRHLLEWYTCLLANSASQTIVVQRLGAPRTVVTANQDNVEYMLKTNFSNYPKGAPFARILGDFLGCGIFNVDGELWHAQRKLASHEFSARSLREFTIDVLKVGVEERLVPLLESLATAEETAAVVDLQELLKRLAFDTVCKITLGIDSCCLDSSSSSILPSLARAFEVASEICAERGAAPVAAAWKIKRALGIGSERRLKKAIEEIHACISDIVRKRREEEEDCPSRDLLSRLILAGHDDEVVRDMAISFVMAGRDTTSAAMTWLFWLLSCNPEIEREVVKEVVDCGVGSEGGLSYESLKKMRLLEACLYESMRLFPPVAWDSKHAAADDFLPDGTSVRKGDRVTYFPYGMGRMEALWGRDRLKFLPDRWFMEPDKGKAGALRRVCPYQYPVFQAGPRTCLGKDMAFVQMKYVVASMLGQFILRPVEMNRQPIYAAQLTAHMAGGLKVVVRRRKRIRPLMMKSQSVKAMSNQMPPSVASME